MQWCSHDVYGKVKDNRPPRFKPPGLGGIGMRICPSLMRAAACGAIAILAGCMSYYQIPADLQESSAVTLVASHEDNGEVELRAFVSAIDGKFVDVGPGINNWDKPVKIAPGEHIIMIVAAGKPHYTGWRAFAEAFSSAPAWTMNSTAALVKFEAGKVCTVRGKMLAKHVAAVWLEDSGGGPITQEYQLSLVRDPWGRSGGGPVIIYVPSKK